MLGGYYDLDSILSEEERLPIVVTVESRNLGHLDGSDPYSRKHLAAGTKLDLPLWLGLALASKNQASFSVPRCFSQRTCEDIEADPTVIDLYDKSPFWYENGLKIRKHQKEKEKVTAVTHVMQTAFRERYKVIFDRAYSAHNRDVSSFLSKLTLFERALFRIGQLAAVAFENWRNSQGQDPGSRGSKRKLDSISL